MKLRIETLEVIESSLGRVHAGVSAIEPPEVARARRSIPVVAVAVRDNADEQRYEAAVDGDLAGIAAYRSQQGLITFVHTEVDDAFEGHGVGSILVSGALEDVRRRGLEVLPLCPFVNSYIEQHREYVDLVPESRREAFGL